MRRIAAMLLATVLAFVLTACRGREDPAEDDSQTPEQKGKIRSSAYRRKRKRIFLLRIFPLDATQYIPMTLTPVPRQAWCRTGTS